jgi:hypothetical protein
VGFVIFSICAFAGLVLAHVCWDDGEDEAAWFVLIGGIVLGVALS